MAPAHLRGFPVRWCAVCGVLCVQVSKGAPQILLNMSHNADELRPRVQAAVQELADRGFRSLGVGISYTGVDEPTRWEFQVRPATLAPPSHPALPLLAVFGG